MLDARQPAAPSCPPEENATGATMPALGRRIRALAYAIARQRRRRRSGGRAPVQRAADPLAHAPLRPIVEDRGRAPDRPVGPVDLDHHEPPPGRRPAQARSAAARAGRPTNRPGVARSGGRVLDRAEDRPPQLRHGADRLLRRRAPSRPPRPSLSDPRSGDGFRRRRVEAADRIAAGGQASADRRTGGRGAVPIVELVGRDRRTARQDGRLAVVPDRGRVGSGLAGRRDAVQ